MEPLNDNALRIIHKNDQHLTVENYIILFNRRDLEGVINSNINKDGSAGEFFSERTDFESEYTKADNIILDWEHGRSIKFLEPRHRTLGKVLWETMQRSSIGIKVKTIIYRQTLLRGWVENIVEPLIRGVSLHTETEAIPNSVEKSDNGEITKWPLMRNTLTMNLWCPWDCCLQGHLRKNSKSNKHIDKR